MDMPASIREVCSELSVDVRQLGVNFGFIQKNNVFHWSGLNIRDENISLMSKMPALPLPSVVCALQVLAWLDLWDEKIIADVLPNISLAGRLEKITKNDRLWILDVAHNEAGAEYLSEQLVQENIQKVALVFSAMADKDMEAILVALKPFVWRLILFPLLNNSRAASLEQLQAAAAKAGIDGQFMTLCSDVKEMQSVISVMEKNNPVLVCGSFLTVAAVKAEWL